MAAGAEAQGAVELHCRCNLLLGAVGDLHDGHPLLARAVKVLPQMDLHLDVAAVDAAAEHHRLRLLTHRDWDHLRWLLEDGEICGGR